MRICSCASRARRPASSSCCELTSTSTPVKPTIVPSGIAERRGVLSNPHLGLAGRPRDAERRLIVGAGGDRRADDCFMSCAIVVVNPSGISRCGTRTRRTHGTGGWRVSHHAGSAIPGPRHRAGSAERLLEPPLSRSQFLGGVLPPLLARAKTPHERRGKTADENEDEQADVFRRRQAEDVLPQDEPVVDVEQCQDDRERDGELVAEERRKEDRQNEHAGRQLEAPVPGTLERNRDHDHAGGGDRKRPQDPPDREPAPHGVSLLCQGDAGMGVPRRRCARAGRGIPSDEVSNPVATSVWAGSTVRRRQHCGGGVTQPVLQYTPP